MSTRVVGHPATKSLSVKAPGPVQTFGFQVYETQKVTVSWDLGAHGATFQAGEASVSLDGTGGNELHASAVGKRRGCGFLGIAPCQGSASGKRDVTLRPGKYVLSVAAVADYSEAHATIAYTSQHLEEIPDVPKAAVGDLVKAVSGNPQASSRAAAGSVLAEAEAFLKGPYGPYALAGGGLVVLLLTLGRSKTA